MRRKFFPTSTFVLFSYFIVAILVGSVVLSFDVMWGGERPLRYLDALFTAASAVCVTGLITVDTALYTVAGQIVIAALIQAGGLGIIVFTTLYLTATRGRMSFADRRLVRDYYVQSVEYEPRRIVRTVVGVTVAVEIVGAAVLYAGFSRSGTESPLFAAVFHSISAFCNAGFSLFSDNLEGFANVRLVTVPVLALIVIGGVEFVVLQDVAKRFFKRRHVLSAHAKVVLTTTGGLIIVGALLILATEAGTGTLDDGGRVWNAVFQSVTPRTAGFNTVPQDELRLGTKLVTMALMFIGGAPGSIAGGVKVTPVLLLFAVVFLGADQHGEVRIFRRRMPEKLVAKAQLFILKAALILTASVFALSLTESLAAEEPKAFLDIAFEALSAFATVGLSTGITSSLTDLGKTVVILTMFAGRVGLISLALPKPGRFRESGVDYPTGEVLLG